MPPGHDISCPTLRIPEFGMSERPTDSPLDRPALTSGGASPTTPAAAGTAVIASDSHWPFEAIKWFFSFPAMLGALLTARVFEYFRHNFLLDPDFWWHIKVGRDIWQTHYWPSTDAYSYTAYGTPWIAYEWLGEIILSGVAGVGGVIPLFVLLVVVASCVTLALYYYGTICSGNYKAGFLCIAVMGYLTLLSFSLRPQMFGYLFLVLTLIVLQKFRQGVVWPLWTLPFLFLLWVNTHGSFAVGLGALAVYLCCGLKSFQVGDIKAMAWSAKQRIQLELALLLSLAVLPITPYGGQLAVYPFDMMFNQPLNLANVNEWRSMPFNEHFGKLFLGVLVLLVVLQLLFRLTWRLEDLLLAIGGTVMACIHARMLLVFVPFFVPVFAIMAARLLPPYQRAKERYVLNAVIMTGVLLAMIYFFPSPRFLLKRLEVDFPIQAVKYLDAHDVPGPMLNNYRFGGYLIETGHRVFIDGRGDLYERSGVLRDAINASQMKPGAFQVLDRYQINSCLLTVEEPLAVALAASAEWERVYSDRRVSIMVRRKLFPKRQLQF